MTTKKTRIKHAPEFKAEALKLAEKVGVAAARRIQKELEGNGNKHDVKTIAASMKRQSLVAKAARKFKCTTDSKHKLPVAPSLLEQNYNATAPNLNGLEVLSI
jgi:transposase InsO family protein